ncbi:winged helix-turn-helix domain-containing protein [Actinoplanes sp. KI2]|uniref:BTAD domain-containing putative transcriptional regulator n=1 Tax=Actinoplanes sp. KI2 TaxID=2983315 RepID=UPI0021D5AEB0|nr:BTAD domain-containing putative transcriptional regulator [Actinoplanes sp. KI2]MCU7723599.1 winged helix-turn-helix domain-containing protein [Actinoplanes sp. KI2]
MLRVSVLGQLAVTAADGTVLPAGELPRRARQVLAVLAARHGRIQTKDALADAVWGTDLPGNHVSTLEHYVSVIRRRLQPDDPASACFIVTQGGGYFFDTGRAILDLAELRQQVRDLDGLPGGDPERVKRQEEILALARELPFPEDPYADWADSARVEVQIAAVAARVELATASLPTDPTRALRLAQEAIELNPFLERAYQMAMEAAAALDRRDDALRFFERCRQVLHDELGVTPSDDLMRLRRQMLADRRTGDTPKTAHKPARPSVPERFLGRVAELRVLLEPQRPRMVHIVGPSGSGKSAFLAELARHLVGRVGIGVAGSSVGVHRLAWLHAALAQLGAGPEVLAVVDAAEAERPLCRSELELIGAALGAPAPVEPGSPGAIRPVVLAVDDAADLDAAGVAELAWLSANCPALHLVLAYCYPSEIVRRPLSGLGTPVVLRLEPLTAEELAPLGDDTLLERTGGIPALVAAAARPREIALGVAMQTARARTRWMSDPAWEILRLCAVLGDLSAADLVRLTDYPAGEVLATIDGLVHARLLGERDDGLAGHRATLIRDAVAGQVSGASARYLRELRASW